MTVEITRHFIDDLERRANAPDIVPDTCEVSSDELHVIVECLRRGLRIKRGNVTQREIDSWCVQLYVRAGIRTVVIGETLGLVDVPGKYAAVIDAMHLAITNLSHGDGLPEFTAAPAKKKRKKKE